MNKQRKVGIIGLGHVGAHVAYTLCVRAIADELVLVDINNKKLASECQDLRDAVAYHPHRVTINSGTYEDLADCDIIVNAAGKIDLLRESLSRVTEMDFTIPQVRDFCPKLKAAGFKGVFLNITNPCDIVAHEAANSPKAVFLVQALA